MWYILLLAFVFSKKWGRSNVYDYCSLVQVPPETEGKSLENKMDEENASFHLLFPLLFTADEAEVTELGRAFPCGEKKEGQREKERPLANRSPQLGVYSVEIWTRTKRSRREKNASPEKHPQSGWRLRVGGCVLIFLNVCTMKEKISPGISKH